MNAFVAALVAAGFAGALLAQGPTEKLISKAGSNLTYHGGPVVVTAKVVDIFWGPSFANAASPDHTYATTLESFRNQFGTSGTYNVITQYSHIQLSNLGTGTTDWFDPSTPPTNVTDAAVQAEIVAYLANHPFDSSTVYEVFLPSTSYSSNGGSTSCGGPSLAYCSYHGQFTSSGRDVKYSVQPYPSCSGCTVSGWTSARTQETFVCRDTLNTVTDPDFNAWFDASGSEAASKCSAPPFGSTAACCVWSNKASACVC